MFRYFLFLCLTLFLFFIPLSAEAASAGTSITVTICGNGIIEGNEQCDGSSLNEEDCASQGYDSGSLSCSGSCTFDTSNCATDDAAPPSGGGGGGGIIHPPATEVILQGKAYPSALLTVLKDGQIIIETKANVSADFNIEITNITPGTYTFSIWATDKDGVKSITFSFTVTVRAETITTIGGIFIPPTITLSKDVVNRGEILDIYGQTAPKSNIDINIRSEEIVKKTSANQIGVWGYAFNTAALEEGTHIVKARSLLDGLTSGFSHLSFFDIGKKLLGVACQQADLNGDSRVNLVDFSILLYWWGRANDCADQDNSGVVDLADFSIMMYWWTG